MTTVLLVGCGNMGHAMLKGWIDGDRIEGSETIVVEPSDGLRERAASLGVKALSSPDGIEAGAAPDFVVLAVKPQVIRDVVPAYRRFAEAGSTFLSVAAGTRIETFAGLLGSSTAIIRCMPNTPAAIGQGMMVMVANEDGQARLDAARELLSANGEVATVEREELMDAVTAVSGSGPAYVFHFIECLTAAGEAAGLPRDVAALLAMQTVNGAGSLAASAAEEPAELRRQVTSPNGTTAAALDVLMGGDRLKTLVVEAVEAARKRSVELG